MTLAHKSARGRSPPAASGDHPEAHLAGWTGLLQADAYAGYNRLYDASRRPEPVAEALYWAHARRKFFELADIAANKRRGKGTPPISPLALKAVRRIDPLFDIECEALGRSAADRLAVRTELSKPRVEELESWMRTVRAGMSKHVPVAKAMDYMLTLWEGFTRFLHDGRVCLTNNAAERALRGIALGRRAWPFCGSDRGGQCAAAMYSVNRLEIGTLDRRGKGTPLSW